MYLYHHHIRFILPLNEDYLHVQHNVTFLDEKRKTLHYHQMVSE